MALMKMPCAVGNGSTLTQIDSKVGSVTVSTSGYSVLFSRHVYTGVLVSELTWIVGTDTTSKTEGWNKLPFSSSTPHSSSSVTNNNNGTITFSDYNEVTITVYGI